MKIEFLKPMLFKTAIGTAQSFAPGQIVDFPADQGMRLLRAKGPAYVRMADAPEFNIGEQVVAQRICPLPLRAPGYCPPTMVRGRVIQIDESRQLAKIESLSSDDFWSPLARVRKI